jgi:hypothetical protein
MCNMDGAYDDFTETENIANIDTEDDTYDDTEDDTIYEKEPIRTKMRFYVQQSANTNLNYSITAHLRVLLAALHCTAPFTASKRVLVITQPCLLFSALYASVVGAHPPEWWETQSLSFSVPSSSTLNRIHLCKESAIRACDNIGPSKKMEDSKLHY